jgi:hypothetical protein
MDVELAAARLRVEIAACRFRLAAHSLLLALRYNPNWHLQPRVSAGHPDGGQWTVGLPVIASTLPALIRVAPPILRVLRARARQVARFLLDLPQLWTGDLPSEDDFTDPTRRIGPPTPRRPGHEQIRFRSGRELREYLGSAGEGRQWHHLVEARLAGRRFPPELVHSTDNIVSLPIEVHRRVSAKMSSNLRYTEGKTLRKWLEPKPFAFQHKWGMRLVREALQELSQ